MQKIQIGIVDDHQVIINGLTTMLSNFDTLEVVYTSTQSVQVIKQLERITLDILLLDIQMPQLDGIELTKLVTKTYPSIKVLVFSSFENSHYVKQAIRNGAAGYLLKNADHQIISEAINQV